MKHKQVLAASALTLCGAMVPGVINVHAGAGNWNEPTAVTTLDDLNICLSAGDYNVCSLMNDIEADPDYGTSLNIPSSAAVKLDLHGHSLGTQDKKERLTITNHGVLVITSGHPDRIIGSLYGYIYNEDGGTLTIEKGSFYGSIQNSFNASIDGGTFYGTVRTNGWKMGIYGGTFREDVVSNNGSSLTIEDGRFERDVSLHSTGLNKIVNGYFGGTVFGGYANSTVEISGGTFSNLNFINYNEGSSLSISGGTFSKGFSVGVEHLSITGGKFMNGSSDDGGWLALILDHPDVQDYSITGGEFVNTKDEYGYLMAIRTNDKPTEASIRKLFEGGDVLSGMQIKLDDSEGATHWSYIMKQKTATPEETDDAEAPAKTPDTGGNTINEKYMSATSIVALIATVLVGSLAIGAATRYGLRKKVSFNKK